MDTRNKDKYLRDREQDRRESEKNHRPTFSEDVKNEEGFEEVEEDDADEREEEVEDVEGKVAELVGVPGAGVFDEVTGGGSKGGVNTDVGYPNEEDQAGTGGEGDGERSAVVEELVAN